MMNNHTEPATSTHRTMSTHKTCQGMIEAHLQWLSRQFSAIDDGLTLNVRGDGTLEGNCLDSWIRENAERYAEMGSFNRLQDALFALRRCIERADSLCSTGNEELAYRLLDVDGSILSDNLIDAFLDLQESLEYRAAKNQAH